MANKRMFTMHIVDSDAFLDMPLSAQCLYFHLNMRADDDGFIGNPKRVQRLIGASDDDFKILIAKRFVLAFEDGVIVIKHWRMHNTIRADRYTPTAYQEELSMLLMKDNKSYSLTSGNQMATTGFQNVSTDIGIGLDIDLDKDIEKDSKNINYQQIVDMYNDICISFPKCIKISDSRKKAIKARSKKYSVEDFEKVFKNAEESDFLKGQNNRNWSATLDWMLKDANFIKVLEGNYANKGDCNNKPISKSKNRFHNFEQRDTDYDGLVAQYYGYGEENEKKSV